VPDIKDVLSRWHLEGETIAMATVIRVDGSAPRSEGAKMLVTQSGRVEGSVSGGCVEGDVVEAARSVMKSGTPVTMHYGINKNMMWDIGLSCGGAIDVFIELLPKGSMPTFESGVVSCTVVSGPDRVGERMYVRPSAGGAAHLDGTLGSAELDAAVRTACGRAGETGASRVHTIGAYEIFVDPQLDRPRLVIVGAVHIAAALCDYATRSGFSVTVIDPRERLNNRERFPAAAHLVVGWPEDELPALGFDDNTYVAVLTHDEKFDDPTLDYVLRRNVRYVGAIGSKKTQALRRKRLADAGISPASIDRLHAPIGLDIGAESPEEIAVAILAEMIATKYRHGGAPLMHREEPHIHA
jgi:xanthine dehydrogenase accessory factor